MHPAYAASQRSRLPSGAGCSSSAEPPAIREQYRPSPRRPAAATPLLANALSAGFRCPPRRKVHLAYELELTTRRTGRDRVFGGRQGRGQDTAEPGRRSTPVMDRNSRHGTTSKLGPAGALVWLDVVIARTH